MQCENCNGTGKATAYGGTELLECLCCCGTGRIAPQEQPNESEREDFQLNPTPYRKELGWHDQSITNDTYENDELIRDRQMMQGGTNKYGY